MASLTSQVSIGFLALLLLAANPANTCRVNSESLKSYTKDSIELLLDRDLLGSIYWPDEPLDASKLSKAIGFNVTLAETHFSLGQLDQISGDELRDKANSSSHSEPLVRDFFISCSVGRDRSYKMAINLELANPFDVIDVYFELPSENRRSRNGHLRIHLMQSSFLAQVSQTIRYDECLDVNYVQLAQNVSYDIECVNCNEEQAAHVDKIFNRRMSHLDAELDSMLSEKLLIGLQKLLSQQRLELDLYL